MGVWTSGSIVSSSARMQPTLHTSMAAVYCCSRMSSGARYLVRVRVRVGVRFAFGFGRRISSGVHVPSLGCPYHLVTTCVVICLDTGGQAGSEEEETCGSTRGVRGVG